MQKISSEISSSRQLLHPTSHLPPSQSELLEVGPYISWLENSVKDAHDKRRLCKQESEALQESEAVERWGS